MTSEFLKAMSTLERRFTSGNSVPIESARITEKEFRAIEKEVQRLVVNEEIVLLTNHSLRETISELEAEVQKYVEAQPPI